jgi:RNA polymerase sigma factor (sigma-70 family)
VVKERELVDAALSGDPEAFARLVGVHRRRVETVVATMVGSEEAEDVVQEALLRAYLSLPRLAEPDRFGSWLCGIAINVAKMRLRRRALERRVAVAGGTADPLVELDEREFLGTVADAVRLLPSSQRDVVLMHYVDDLSCEEIARLLGTNAGAIRVRLHRARAQLRRELAPLAPTPLVPARKEVPMIDMTIDDVLVRVGSTDEPKVVAEQRIVVLQERDGDRLLPIWIGSAEGNALALRMTGDAPPRPTSGDLMVELLRVCGGKVIRVAITSLREQTFHAAVTIGIDGRRDESRGPRRRADPRCRRRPRRGGPHARRPRREARVRS